MRPHATGKTASAALPGDAADPAAVVVRGVSKSFLLPHERHGTLKQRILHPLAGGAYEVLEALREVSVDVGRGEFLGIVGKNGSGKSTLLRCIAGIYAPDAGEIAVRGRLAAFIELGLGFHPELAARDNVLTSAVLFGLGPREARARFDEILAFAELERFADQKLKNYSTGMAVRLAFSVAVHVDADVLLFDEVLAVGDESFQRKCFAHFERLRSEGRTIVLVTHRMEDVRRFCHRALLLDRGEIVEAGEPETVARAYEERSRAAPAPRPVAGPLDGAPAAAAAWRRRRAPLLGPDRARFWTLVWTLAVSEFRLKYAGTTLNYLWAIARPLALFAVLLVVFRSLGRFDEGVLHYPALLLTNVILWTFFLQVTSTAVQCLVVRAPLLRKLPFPHLAVPLSVALTGTFDLGINLAVVIAFLLASGIVPGSGWLELPLLLGVLGALTLGFSLLLAALYVRHRDVAQVWLVASQTIFYLTPIFYVAGRLPAPWDRVLVLANPVATVLTEARHALVDPAAPSAAQVAGGAPWLLVPLAIVFATLGFGLRIFGRESPRVAENV